MKIHYLNAKGQEKFIDGVVHLQNIDNYTFRALMRDGAELTLRVSGIEGIVDMTELEKEAIPKAQEGK